jgi:hypothetical protein
MDRHGLRFSGRFHRIEIHSPSPALVRLRYFSLTSKLYRNSRSGPSLPPNWNDLLALKDHVIRKNCRQAELSSDATVGQQNKKEQEPFTHGVFQIGDGVSTVISPVFFFVS